jgi:hypothetical protein
MMRPMTRWGRSNIGDAASFKFQRLGEWMGRKLKIVCACLALGSAYGAALGALDEALFLTDPAGIPTAALDGAVCGAVFGALAGGISGVLGSLVGGILGWSVAAVFGSVSVAACLWHIAVTAQTWNHASFLWPQGALTALGVALIGSFLGLALDAGLESGRSAVPGVQRLAEIIRVSNPPRDNLQSRGQPTEVAPSGAPEGRGDETLPGHPTSSRCASRGRRAV